MASALGTGKKDALAWLLAAAGVSAAAGRLRRGPARALTILAYHRIFDMGAEDGFPWDPELVSATLEDFRWQMRTLRERCTPIHVSHAARLLAEGRELPARAVAVTFDDGHRDNYTHAFPVMREAGIPATIFLSTGYIGRPGTFWFDRVAHVLYRTQRARIELPAIGMQLEISGVASRREAAGRLLSALKEVPDGRRREVLEALEAAAAPVGPPDDRSAALTWAQVREMHAGGIEFGSHTVDHPILAQVPDEGLARELGESRREIERQLQAEVPLLAYPVGGESAYDERVVRSARDCGYSMALTYIPGVNPWPVADAFRLRRLHVERYTTRARFEAMLAFPTVFA